MTVRTQKMNRTQIMAKSLEVSCKRIVKYLDQEIQRIEKRLAKYVEDQAEWTEKQEILKSAPGVGDTLVYTLPADLPELGSLNRKKWVHWSVLPPLIETAEKWKVNAVYREVVILCVWFIYGNTQYDAM